MIFVFAAAAVWLVLLVVVVCVCAIAGRADRELEPARTEPRLRVLPGGGQPPVSSSSGKPTALAGRSSRNPL
jgi:hypothetical protein